MNILIAPNSMKGSLSAFDFADVVEEAFIQCSAKFVIRKAPVADGGDYTGEVLRRAFNATNIPVQVRGPLGEKINAKYAVFGQTAIIEMADASGMKLIDADLLNPLKTSTFGTGQMIFDAMENGCSELFLAIGGSATVDGGMGMMEALGFQFFDKNGMKLAGNGLNLSKVKSIQKPEMLAEISIKIICDVDNPLLGKNGAAAVFGPQKGATFEMIEILENGLRNWANIIQRETGKNILEMAGTGAAGGIAVPLLSFFNAEIVSGAEFVLHKLDFEKKVKWADLVITGEGKIDTQTLNNKAPFAVAKMAKKHGKQIVAFAGAVEQIESELFDEIVCISEGIRDRNYAIENAKELLFNSSVKFAKQLSSKL